MSYRSLGTFIIVIKLTDCFLPISVYGSVTSLNLEPEPGVYMEAVGIGSSQCMGLEEDSQTEQDGTYRIRGLQVRQERTQLGQMHY